MRKDENRKEQIEKRRRLGISMVPSLSFVAITCICVIIIIYYYVKVKR